MLLVGLVGRVGTGSRRDFFVACPGALAASHACCVTNRWFAAFVLMPGWLMLPALLHVNLFGLLVGLILLIGPPLRLLVLFRMFGISLGRFLVRYWKRLFLHFGVQFLGPQLIDDFWSIWSRSAEEGLFRAYSRAGGPTVAGRSAFLGRGLLRIRNRRLGGRAAGGKGSSRLYRVSRGDVHCAQYFINSSLSLVLLFRGRLKSVADVLRGIRNKVFTQSRWDALLGF